MSRVVVIGAGLAGLCAAVRLAQGGATVTLVTKGFGGLRLSQGTVDILGYRTRTDRSVEPVETTANPPSVEPVETTANPPSVEPVETTANPPSVEPVETTANSPSDEPVETTVALHPSPSERVSRPLDALTAFAAAHPDHPYAALGAPVVRTAVTWLRDVLGPELLVGDPDVNVALPTAVGALRPTALVQPSMLAGDLQAGSSVAIVGPRQLKDFHPALIAGNLARTELPGGGRANVRGIVIDLPSRASEIESSPIGYAKAFENPNFRTRFVSQVRPLVGTDDSVGLPAVLGIADSTVWRQLAEGLERPVFEIPLPPPSVAGLRLDLALTRAAKAAGVRIILGSAVVGHRAQGSTMVSVTIATAGAPREVSADAFVLASGGFESGSLAIDSYGRVRETVLDLPLAGLDAQPLIHGDYWGADQPLFRVGVAVDPEMRVLGPEGIPEYDNLRAVGGILAGATRWREKSGDGIAVASAVRAADSILGVRS